MTAATFRKDQVVWVLDSTTMGPSVKFPGEWTVVKPNQTTVDLIQGGKRLRAHKTLIVTEKPEGTPGMMDYRAPWVQGTIVRWDAAPERAGGKLFVVISDDGMATVSRIVLLGGDGGRYWKKVRATALAEVNPAELLSK